jgi:hypothetical protein
VEVRALWQMEMFSVVLERREPFLIPSLCRLCTYQLHGHQARRIGAQAVTLSADTLLICAALYGFLFSRSME